MVNRVLRRWLNDEPSLKPPPVDCEACTLSALRPHARERWAKYKCCTFQPFVANFLAGAMLKEGLDPLALQPEKAILLPIGIVATHQFRALHARTAEDERGEAHLCSYYDLQNGRCRVWSHRPGECSAHYCTPAGLDARENYSQRLFTLETAVAQMALLELGFSCEAIAAQVDQLNDPILAPNALAPEPARAFYLRAWEWAAKLNREEVDTLLADG